jgi:hypothetical protein
VASAAGHSFDACEREMNIDLGKGHIAIVDDADYDSIRAVKWISSRRYSCVYAAGRLEGKTVLMHRMILGFPASRIDHINSCGLDNRRSNLRLANHFENMRNRQKLAKASSKFKGVRISGMRWRADIEQLGEKLYLGMFDTEEQAARQYDRAARLCFGPFAKTNETLGLL